MREANLYLNHLAIPDMAISIGFVVVVTVIVPIALVVRPIRAVLVLMGITVRVSVVSAVASQELGCNRLYQQDQKES